jgi:hypothetical protein
LENKVSNYYDKFGKPITQDKWTIQFGDYHNRVVAQHTISGVQISTVWLGLDHQYGDGPPLIFETMVFGGPMDQEMDRYSTLEEAKTGHRRMVTKVKAGLKQL